MNAPSNLDDRRDARFDGAMRGLHAAAVAHLSPQLRWKLRPAPALTGGVAGHFGTALLGNWRVGVAYASVAAVAFAVAIGFGLQQPASNPATAEQVAEASAQADAISVLEQDPEFLAWLASDDANMIASVE